MNLLVAVLELVTMTTVDGRQVAVNPNFVVSISTPKPGGTLSTSVNCVVTFIDGKFLSMKETCAEVRDQLHLPRDISNVGQH